MGLANVLAEIHEGRDKRYIAEFLKDRLSAVEDVLPIRPGEYFRVSRIPKACAREEVLCSRSNIVRTRKFTMDQRWWMDVGTIMHRLFQEMWLGPMGVLTRIEEKLVNEEFKVAGHMDGILCLPDRPSAVVDFKNVQEYEFHKWSEAPNPNHVKQLQTYMWLAGQEWGVLLYVNKQESRVEHALTEHWIRQNERQIEAVKRTLFAIKEGVEKGVFPSGVCCARNERRAQQCQVREACFGTGNGP